MSLRKDGEAARGRRTVHRHTRPEGTTELGCAFSAVPSGLDHSRPSPAVNCRAILSGSFGTRLSVKQFAGKSLLSKSLKKHEGDAVGKIQRTRIRIKHGDAQPTVGIIVQ